MKYSQCVVLSTDIDTSDYYFFQCWILTASDQPMPDKTRSQPALRNVGAVHFELHAIHEHQKDHAARPREEEEVRPEQRALGLEKRNTSACAFPSSKQRARSNGDRTESIQRNGGRNDKISTCDAAL